MALFSAIINVMRWRKVRGIFCGCWRMLWWCVNAPGISEGGGGKEQTGREHRIYFK